MRVLCVISSLAAGGAQRVLVDLAHFLVDRGHRVAVLTYASDIDDHFVLSEQVDRHALPPQARVGRLPLPSRAYANFIRFMQVRLLIRDISPDVVLSFIDITNVVVLAASRGLQTPVVVSERVHPRYHRIGFWWSVLRRVLYPFADRLVVQTSVIQRWSRWVVPQTKVRVIPNSVASVGADDIPTSRESIVVAVGRLHTQKGFDLLVRAFADSSIWRDGWRLVIIGEGPERANLEALIEEHDLRSSISLPGETARPQDWYRRCGIFVLSSRFEGFPNVLLEAMSFGAPCVAFDCPSGPAEIVRPGVDAELLPQEDVVALTSTLSRLASDSEARKRLGAAATGIDERFSPGLVFAEWERLLHEVARRP